jgi:hypothetical protein
MKVTRRSPLPPGAVGYIALVQRVPAGSEGSAVARQLVRALVGPLPLDDLKTKRQVDHWRAVRLPSTERPDQLASVGWIETEHGKVIAAAQAPHVDCSAAVR